jgi:hypothetical protein
MFKLAGLLKWLPVKVVNGSFIFDITVYDYDHQITLLTHNLKEKCCNVKTYVCNKNNIFILITVFNVNS